MFKFLTHRPLWVNILAVLLITAILIMGFFGSLNFLTKHDDYEKVPSIVGKNVDEARRILTAKGFEVEIQDSIYIDTVPKLAVIKQSPEGDATVKVNRTIYLTVNRSQPPLVEMPNLIGFSIRNAEMYLENLGLHIGDTTFRPDIAKNAVLEQLYNGKPITAGTKIYMGSAISFVLGNGISDAEMTVPDLVGKTYSQARSLLRSMDINSLAVPLYELADTANSFVQRQDPEVYTETNGQKAYNRIRPGQTINLYLGKDKPVKDSTAIKEPPADNGDNNN